jgi:hypothetical protein
MNPIRTGYMDAISPSGVTAHDDFAIDDDGVEIRTISKNPGAIETHIYRNQFEEVARNFSGSDRCG